MSNLYLVVALTQLKSLVIYASTVVQLTDGNIVADNYVLSESFSFYAEQARYCIKRA